RAAGSLQKEQNLSDIPDKVKARTALQLGSAATLDATNAVNDCTPGRVLKVGDFGLGAQTFGVIPDSHPVSERAAYGVNFSRVFKSTDVPRTDTYYNLLMVPETLNGTFAALAMSENTTPFYRAYGVGSNKSIHWAKIYDELNKPTATDVGALPIIGGTITGPVGIGTENALGGNSIVLGDNDTGLKQEGDGILNVYANSALVMRFISSLIESLKPLKVNGNCIATGEMQAANGAVRIATDGNLYGTKWGGWLDAWLKNNYQPKGSYTPAGQAYTKAESDARYVQDIRLGAQVLVSGSGNGGKASLTAPSGHMLTAILDGDTSRWPMPDSPDQAYARPIQKLVNGKWITVVQL
ncbi:hypothetical protein YG33_004883, partial [Salmonella enterica subsp. enterica]|nr:hypothetical protein [Salmonella enterica subsp. enterica]